MPELFQQLGNQMRRQWQNRHRLPARLRQTGKRSEASYVPDIRQHVLFPDKRRPPTTLHRKSIQSQSHAKNTSSNKHVLHRTKDGSIVNRTDCKHIFCSMVAILGFSDRVSCQSPGTRNFFTPSAVLKVQCSIFRRVEAGLGRV